MKLEPEHVIGRHPAVVQLAGYFDAGRVGTFGRPYAAEIEHTARTMLASIPDSPELTVGLRKLLEARDCFIRAAKDAHDRNELRPVPGATEPKPRCTTPHGYPRVSACKDCGQ